MYEFLYTLETTAILTIGTTTPINVLFGKRHDQDKVTVYIVEMDGQNVIKSDDIQQQLPLIARRCLKDIHKAKQLN
jgi:hypothetical protein